MLALRLQRLYISQASRQSRLISSSRVNGGMLDYLNFYKRKQNQNKDLVAAPKVKNTDDLIADLERNSELKTGEAIEDEIEQHESIEILGALDPQFHNQELIAEQLQADGFTVSKWIQDNSLYSESISELETTDYAEYIPVIDKILSELYTQNYGSELKELSEEELNNIQLSDLTKRFQFIKQVQINFGITIDDFKLTQMHTLSKVRSHLVAQLNPDRIVRNEKLPNAIYLRTQDYEGTNVYIQDHVFKTEKEKATKRLVEEAIKAEDAAFAKLQ